MRACPGDLVTAVTGRNNNTHITWIVAEDVELPSPGAALFALDEARSGVCTALECQLALMHAGAAQCCSFSRNVALVTPKNIYFHYQKNYL